MARLRALGMEPFGGASAAFGARIATESARWKTVVVAARIPLQQ
jgi:hypothetical protein